MGGNYFGNAGEFLLQTLFGLYILVVMLRFLMQMVRADFYNPLSQFIVKVTNPPLRPLRRIIPGLGGIDLASVVLMLLLQMVELYLIGMLRGALFAPLGVFLMAAVELLSLALNVYLFAIIIQVIISWINPGVYNPVTAVLHALTDPLMRPARRMIPPISGLDLSPLLVLIGLQLVAMVALAPLRDLASKFLL